MSKYGSSDGEKLELIASMASVGGPAGIVLGILSAIFCIVTSVIDWCQQAKQFNAELPIKANEFANKITDIDFNHIMFSEEQSYKLGQIPIEAEGLEVKERALEIKGQKVDLTIDKASFAGRQARTAMFSASIQAKEAKFAFAKAALAVEQSAVHLQEAKFGLRKAVIEAGRADADYEYKVKQLKLALIKSKKNAAEATKKYVEEMSKTFDPWIKYTDAISKYTKYIGGSKELMQRLRTDAVSYAIKDKIETKFNMSSEEMMKLKLKFTQEVGRKIDLTDEQGVALGALNAMVGDENAVKFSSAFNNLGIDFDRTNEIIGKVFYDAAKNGIGLEKATKMFSENINMVQTYKFERGLESLYKMSEKAAALGFSMEDTGKFAEKASNIDETMELTSDLAVLGSGFRNLSNPLVMLNESLSDVSALQTRIIEMVGGLAHFSKKNGEITMSAYNKKRVKTASETMGVSYENLMNTSMTQAKRKQLQPQVDNLNIDEDLKELLLNTAQLDKNGKGYVNVEGQNTSLDKAAMMNSQKLSSILRKQSQPKSQNIMDIAIDLRSIKDIIEGWNKRLDDYVVQTIESSGVGEEFTNFLDGQSTNDAIMKDMAKAITDINKEYANAQKEMDEFTYKYKSQIYELEAASADLERDIAHYQTTVAKASLDAANLQAAMAPIEFDRARLAQMQAANDGISAAMEKRSAIIQKADAYNRQDALKQKQHAFELDSTQGYDIKKKSALYEFLKQKGTDDLYATERDKNEIFLDTEQTLKIVGSLEKLDFVGIASNWSVGDALRASAKIDMADNNEALAFMLERFNATKKDDYHFLDEDVLLATEGIDKEKAKKYSLEGMGKRAKDKQVEGLQTALMLNGGGNLNVVEMDPIEDIINRDRGFHLSDLAGIGIGCIGSLPSAIKSKFGTCDDGKALVQRTIRDLWLDQGGNAAEFLITNEVDGKVALSPEAYNFEMMVLNEACKSGKKAVGLAPQGNYRANDTYTLYDAIIDTGGKVTIDNAKAWAKNGGEVTGRLNVTVGNGNAEYRKGWHPIDNLDAVYVSLDNKTNITGTEDTGSGAKVTDLYKANTKGKQKFGYNPNRSGGGLIGGISTISFDEVKKSAGLLEGSTSSSYSKENNFVKCNVTLKRSKKNVDERVEKMFYNMLNNPTIVKKMSTYILEEFTINDKFGYQKTSSSISHNYI